MEAAQLSSKKKIGNVTPEEKDVMQYLFERKNGLSELFQTLTTDNVDSGLYDKIVTDMSQVITKMRAWWDEKSKKYDWENVAGCNWEIDFNTCDIFLVKK